MFPQVSWRCPVLQICCDNRYLFPSRFQGYDRVSTVGGDLWSLDVKIKIGRRAFSTLPAVGRPTVFHDTDLTGFGLKAAPTGAASFIVEYRPGAGGHGVSKRRMVLRTPKALAASYGSPQLFFAPSLIHARMASRSHLDSCFLPCGIRNAGDARQSSSSIKLLDSGSPAMTIRPNFVPFMTPS